MIVSWRRDRASRESDVECSESHRRAIINVPNILTLTLESTAAGMPPSKMRKAREWLKGIIALLGQGGVGYSALPNH